MPHSMDNDLSSDVVKQYRSTFAHGTVGCKASEGSAILFCMPSQKRPDGP